MDDDLDDDVADAEDDAAGQDTRGGTVLVEDLAQQAVPFLHDFKDDCHEQNRHNTPDQRGPEGGQKTLDFRAHVAASAPGKIESMSVIPSCRPTSRTMWLVQTPRSCS